MKLQHQPRAPEQEQKMVLLRCLDQFGPCTELQMVRFLMEHDLMNYFDMMFALNELCDQGQAARSKARAGYRYELTEAGREALALFGGRVPRSVQTLLQKTGREWQSRFQGEDGSRTEIRRAENGEYETVLEVVDRDKPVLTLRLMLPSREMASKTAEKWPRKAAEIYGTVVRLLAEEEK